MDSCKWLRGMCTFKSFPCNLNLKKLIKQLQRIVVESLIVVESGKEERMLSVHSETLD